MRAEVFALPIKYDIWNKKEDLTLFIAEGYDFKSADINGKRCIIISPVDSLTALPELKKQIKRIRSIEAFHNIFVLINCIAAFVTCQYINEHSRLIKKLARPIASLGGCMLGVYLLHIYIKAQPILNDFLHQIFLEQLGVPKMLYAFILCGAVFICGYIITMMLKRIPILRRLVS